MRPLPYLPGQSWPIINNIEFDALTLGDFYALAVMFYEFMTPSTIDVTPITLAEFKQKLEGVLRE
jgi:hypothetical protein